MNILISNPYLQAGGTESRIMALAEQYVKHGHKASFLVYGEPGTGQEAEGQSSIYKTTYNMGDYIAGKVIERDKIELVQVHNYQNVGLGAISAAKRKNIPVAYYAHDFCSICVKRFMVDGSKPGMKQCPDADYNRCLRCVSPYDLHILQKEQELLNQATISISPSDYFTNILESHNILNGKWRKVAPWISPLFRNLIWCGSYSHSIMFTGNFSPGKNPLVLVKAMPKILKTCPDAILKLIGSAHFRESIVLEARKQKVAKNVTFTDIMPPKELSLEYANAGVACFPSRLPEAFGLVWAEAMTVGAPTIISPVGSIPEYVAGKAVLVDPDDVDGWAEAVLTVFEDKAETVKVANEAKKYAVESFSVERAYDNIMKIYEEMV